MSAGNGVASGMASRVGVNVVVEIAMAVLAASASVRWTWALPMRALSVSKQFLSESAVVRARHGSPFG